MPPGKNRTWKPHFQAKAERWRALGWSYDAIGAQLGVTGNCVRFHLNPEMAERIRSRAREQTQESTRQLAEWRAKRISAEKREAAQRRRELKAKQLQGEEP